MFCHVVFTAGGGLRDDFVFSVRRSANDHDVAVAVIFKRAAVASIVLCFIREIALSLQIGLIIDGRRFGVFGSRLRRGSICFAGIYVFVVVFLVFPGGGFFFRLVLIGVTGVSELGVCLADFSSSLGSAKR